VPEKLLTVSQIAEILGVSRPRAYELLRLNLVPGKVRIGRQIRIDPQRLARWIEDGGQALPGVWKKQSQP